MSDQINDPEGQAPDNLQATPMARINDARWHLVTCFGLAVAAVGLFDLPIAAAGAGLGIVALITAFAPQQLKARRVKVSSRRELRRMWPGTGMKVTVDALPMPCFVADGRGITRYMNVAAANYYGPVKPGDPLSFSLRAPSLLEAFDRVCSKGASERITWVDKVPTEAFFEGHIAPIYMPGSAESATSGSLPDFVIVVINDQTDQRRLERMRTDFVANASHELRTPLASLTGFIETLQGPARDDPKARERFLQIMLEQSGRMRRLIDDILSLSRIELKAHVRPSETVDLLEIVRHTADALAPLASDLDVEMHIASDASEVLLLGDRDELIQVTENLVENALKYGNTGKRVDIKVTRHLTAANRSQWSLTVQDYGKGIPAEHVPRLTERFYRADDSTNSAMKGTGLGLAIVKHILARHKARLEIESTPGESTAFTVHFDAPNVV